MIVPSKHLKVERTLLFVGSQILSLLDEPKTVSRLWDDLKKYRISRSYSALPYDWFILTLDMLYALDALLLKEGRLIRISND